MMITNPNGKPAGQPAMKNAEFVRECAGEKNRSQLLRPPFLGGNRLEFSRKPAAVEPVKPI
jgi:hypothetical protein